MHSYLTGDLTDLESCRLKRHIDKCNKCSDDVQQLELLFSTWSESEADTRAETRELEERISLAVEKKLSTSELKRKRLSAYHFWISGTVIAACSIFSMFFLPVPTKTEVAERKMITLWSRRGIKSFETSMTYAPVIHGNVVIAVETTEDGDRLAAYNLLTGKDLWRSETATLGRLACDSQSVYTIGMCGDSAFLAALDLRSGKLKWSRHLDYEIADMGISAAVSLEHDLLSWSTGRELLLLNASSGRILHRRPLSQKGLAPQPAASDQLIYGIADSILFCLDPFNRKTKWSRVIDHALSTLMKPSLTLDSNRIYTSGRLRNGRAIVCCWNRSDGDLLWKKLDVPAVYLTATSDALLVRSGAVTSLDPQNGRILWRRPVSGCSPVTVHNQNILFTNNSSSGDIIAIDLRTGKHLWKSHVGTTCTGVLIHNDIGLMCTKEGVLKAFRTRQEKTSFRAGFITAA